MSTVLELLEQIGRPNREVFSLLEMELVVQMAREETKLACLGIAEAPIIDGTPPLVVKRGIATRIRELKVKP